MEGGINEQKIQAMEGEAVSYPKSKRRFTAVANGVDVIRAEHINSLQDAIMEMREVVMPANPIKKCDYCGTWGVDKMSCPKCGAPINWEVKHE